jgi:hypothetical protein
MKPTVPTNIKTISEGSAIEQIVETVKKSEQGKAPFALIVGAGFTPLIMTALSGLLQIQKTVINFYMES